MFKIAKLQNYELDGIFSNTADIRHTRDAIIEKDFWVCVVLNYLFNYSPWRKKLVFKGGTCLSKCYNLISRFSEDIDLILDWTEIGYTINEPWAERSNTKQNQFIKEAGQKTEDFLANKFCPKITAEIEGLVGFKPEFSIDPQNKQTVVFTYPRQFQLDALTNVVRLEIGTLAAWSPSKRVEIAPYIYETYPDIFEQGKFQVTAAVPERTFWEKATILHHEANRPLTSHMPDHYSRHYYDLYYLSKIVRETIKNHALLLDVIKFKQKFYPRKWAEYQKAVPATIKLVPPQERFKELEADYKRMRGMIYGDDVPSFEELISSIQILEKEIHETA